MWNKTNRIPILSFRFLRIDEWRRVRKRKQNSTHRESHCGHNYSRNEIFFFFSFSIVFFPIRCPRMGDAEADAPVRKSPADSEELTLIQMRSSSTAFARQKKAARRVTKVVSFASLRKRLLIRPHRYREVASKSKKSTFFLLHRQSHNHQEKKENLCNCRKHDKRQHYVNDVSRWERSSKRKKKVTKLSNTINTLET